MFGFRWSFHKRLGDNKTLSPVNAVMNYSVAQINTRDEAARHVKLDDAADIGREIIFLSDAKFTDGILLVIECDRSCCSHPAHFGKADKTGTHFAENTKLRETLSGFNAKLSLKNVSAGNRQIAVFVIFGKEIPFGFESYIVRHIVGKSAAEADSRDVVEIV